MKKILLILALTAIPAISLGKGCSHAKYQCYDSNDNPCPNIISAPRWYEIGGCTGHWDNQKSLCEAACPGMDFSNGSVSED